MSASASAGSSGGGGGGGKESRKLRGRPRKFTKIEYELEQEEDKDKKPYKRQEDKDKKPHKGRVKGQTPRLHVNEELAKNVLEKGKSASDSSDNVGSTNKAETVGACPENWLQVVENIRKIRLDNPAPVDTMGCERTMDPEAEPSVKRFQTLISLLLSSQTKDEVTFAAMGRLKEYGCTPEKMMVIPDDDLKSLLKPVSFFNTKAGNIKKVSKILLENYDGDIPNTAEGLMQLPGIGPKMTYICMQVAWGVTEGIGVDTHVHRISERLGWTSAKGKKKLVPEDTRKQLEGWLPKNMWQDVNILLVGFGQTICTPINPKCNQCLNKMLCPYGRKNTKQKSSTSK